MKYGKWEVVQPEGHRLRHAGGHVHFVQNTESEDDELYVLKTKKPTGTATRYNPDGTTEEKIVNTTQDFKEEIKLAAMMDHPNVIKVVDYDLEHETPYMVTEWCKGGTLADSDYKNWSLEEKKRCFTRICLGTAYIYSQGYSKADGGSRNTFLKADGRTPVIGDLERCREATTETIAETIRTLAEVFWGMIQGQRFTDAWIKERDLNNKIAELDKKIKQAQKEKAELFEQSQA